MKLFFDSYGDVPNETEQLSSNCGDDQRLVFAAVEHLEIPVMQPILGFPGNLFNFLAEPDLSLQQVAAHPRSELVGPGGFDQDSSQVRVAHLGDSPVGSVLREQRNPRISDSSRPFHGD